jgi:hypothetical protein
MKGAYTEHRIKTEGLLEVLAWDADGFNLDFFLKKLIKHQTETGEYPTLIHRGHYVA